MPAPPARFLAALVFLCCAWPAHALEVRELFAPYTELLARHVTEHELDSGGLVSSFDYTAAIGNPDSRALIDRQREFLSQVEIDEVRTRETALAFWINAYNFFMIAHIVDNADGGRPVGSVKDFGGLFNPFRVFGLRIFDVAGRDHSLDEIEKEILLGKGFEQRGWKDARVHFAVNCASVGCPPLRSMIYTPSNVEALLEENTRRALLTNMHLEIGDVTARLTSLFNWYQDDFEQAAGSVDAFIEQHLEPTREALYQNTREKRFIDYDWDLNSPDNMRQWREDNQ
ncbi:MAG: DUF547 domain-containing protein [Gammaproteobacteria bacterium]|nr:DUF547 domain-containing protein [Gammaproteobacteria bacterium]